MDTVEHDWTSLFANGKSPTKGSVHDAFVLLRWHPDTAGRLAYNTFSSQIVATAKLPWHPHGLIYPRQVDDTDGTRAASWFETQGLFKVGIATAKSCMVAAGRDAPFNPLVDWLHGIAWDGKKRIETWLTYYLGVEDSPYVRAVGPKFLIGAVARALKPGSKVDTMLILEGPQGRYKSTAARTLFGAEWYTDDLADLHSKDAALQMQGKWGIEISELAAMSRSESNRIKAVLSRQVDRFRAPYDRFVAEHPRQCVFIGTTNPVDGYFRDPTGARRFWPVACGTIDKDALAHDREQIWAEAVHAYERNEIWWLEGEQVASAKTEQDDRREVDPWEPIIVERLGSQTWVLVSTILTEWLKVPTERCGKADQMRVAAILKSMGWARAKRREGNNTVHFWQKGEHSAHQEGTLI
jgi:putative DNA primase/helicase